MGKRLEVGQMVASIAKGYRRGQIGRVRDVLAGDLYGVDFNDFGRSVVADMIGRELLPIKNAMGHAVIEEIEVRHCNGCLLDQLAGSRIAPAATEGRCEEHHAALAADHNA